MRDAADGCASLDAVALRDAFHLARMSMVQRAHWHPSDPGIPMNTCPYCQKFWRRWAGSKLDGHAACIVTDDFKRDLKKLLRSSTVTFAAVAEAIGMTKAVVRSWTYPMRSG